MKITFKEVYEEYEKQYKDYYESYREWDLKGRVGTYSNVKYGEIEEMIKCAARNKYPNFSEEKINYIYGKVYEDFHSSFGECIYGMKSLCEFVDKLPEK